MKYIIGIGMGVLVSGLGAYYDLHGLSVLGGLVVGACTMKFVNV